MSFNKTYILYISCIVGLPTLATALISKSVWWTLGLFVVTNIMARLMISLFYMLFRAIGDKSDDSKFNTTLRLVMTEKKYEVTFKRIFPHDNPQPFIATARKAAHALVDLGIQVDSGALAETNAREKIKQEFPYIDKGNTDWLNSRGRIFLRRKAGVFT